MKGLLYIGIDCAPATPRPDRYIKNAAAIFDIKVEDITEPDSKCFGAWTWHIPCNLTKEEFKNKKPLLKSHMDALYDRGSIRGAEWGFEVKTTDELKEAINDGIAPYFGQPVNRHTIDVPGDNLSNRGDE